MSVLQPWVERLGLRHQGALLSGVRGCDTSPKDDASKAFVRCYRGMVLQSHCGDNSKAATFIEVVDTQELEKRFVTFRRSTDHLPHHYVMHMLHCVEIVGYKHPHCETRTQWQAFYKRMCDALHVNKETEQQMDDRLNADEATFAKRDAGWCCDGDVKQTTEFAGLRSLYALDDVKPVCSSCQDRGGWFYSGHWVSCVACAQRDRA